MLLDNYLILKNNISNILNSKFYDEIALGGQREVLNLLYQKAEILSKSDSSQLSSYYVLETMMPKLKAIDIEISCIVDQDPDLIKVLSAFSQIQTVLNNPNYLDAKASFSKTLIDSINHYSKNGSAMIGELNENTAMNIRVASFVDLKNLKAYPVLNCYTGSFQELKYRKSILVGSSRDNLLTEALDPSIPDCIMFAAVTGRKSVHPYFVIKSQGHIVLYEDKSKDQNSSSLILIKSEADRIKDERGIAHLDIGILSANALTWVSLMFTLILETFDVDQMEPAFFLGDILTQSKANAVRKFKQHSDHWALPQISRHEILADQVNLKTDTDNFDFKIPEELLWIEKEFAHLIDDECLNLIGLRTDQFHFNVAENCVVKNTTLDVSAMFLGDKSKNIPLLHLPLDDYADLGTIRKAQLTAARSNFAEIMNHHIGVASSTHLAHFKDWIKHNIHHTGRQDQVLSIVKSLLPFFTLKGDDILKLDGESPLLHISELKAYKNQGVDHEIFGSLNFNMQPNTSFIREKMCVVTDKKATHAIVVKCHSLEDLMHLFGKSVPAAPKYTDMLKYSADLNKICELNANKGGFISGFSAFKTPITITIPFTKTGIKNLLG